MSVKKKSTLDFADALDLVEYLWVLLCLNLKDRNVFWYYSKLLSVYLFLK